MWSPLRVFDHVLTHLLGYPPADHGVRDYLTSPGSKDVAYDRASAFLEALFKHTTSTLHALDSSLDYSGFGGEFRSCMTEGQRMKGHIQFREDFYKRVVEKAKQLEAQRVCNIRVRSYA